MGLLDDAIRDHLELKRRRGADPSEIAREEREALEPVFPDEPRAAGFDHEPQAAGLLDGEPPQGDPLREAAAGAEATGAAEPAAPADETPADPVAAQNFGEETAELDMQAVLEEGTPMRDEAASAAQPSRPVAAQPAGGEAPGRTEALRPPPQGEEDLLEWEVPGHSDAEPPPEPLPGQETMSFE